MYPRYKFVIDVRAAITIDALQQQQQNHISLCSFVSCAQQSRIIMERLALGQPTKCVEIAQETETKATFKLPASRNSNCETPQTLNRKEIVEQQL